MGEINPNSIQILILILVPISAFGSLVREEERNRKRKLDMRREEKRGEVKRREKKEAE